MTSAPKVTGKYQNGWAVMVLFTAAETALYAKMQGSLLKHARH